MDKQLAQIAINFIPLIGCTLAKRLIAYAGSVTAVFELPIKELTKTPGFGTQLIKSLKQRNEALARAEKELAFVKKQGLNILFYLDAVFPQRLKECEDGPLTLYTHGSVDYNVEKVISVIGTRKATEYGKSFCDKLLRDLKSRGHEVLIISGLAYGIDIAAHRAAIANNLPTVGVLAHGLHILYPSVHKTTAAQMVNRGALLTEFTSADEPERQNFVKRNRIVAGMADATLVIESAAKGGALITAEIANSYNRDVMALPGRVGDPQSVGCNALIKQNKAAVIESAVDLEQLLGWDVQKVSFQQRNLFVELSGDEEKIVSLLKEENELTIDVISNRSQLPISKTAAVLLSLEFSGMVKSMPGKVYKLI